MNILTSSILSNCLILRLYLFHPLTFIHFAIELHLIRLVVQDLGDVPAGILHQVLGPVHVLHLGLQHLHEGFLHLSHSLHHLPHAIQKALLHSKLQQI
jgi:hypothetical protein